MSQIDPIKDFKTKTAIVLLINVIHGFFVNNILKKCIPFMFLIYISNG